jgi:glycosyltransferase involved in cell wall biosynthesis
VRALFLTDVFFPDTIGGAGRTARKLAEGLCREMDVVVATRNEGGRLPAWEVSDGLEIRRFIVDRSSSRRFFASAVLNSAMLVRRLTSDKHFDRLILNQPLSGIAALPLLKTTPTVYTFHSPWSEEYRIQVAAHLRPANAGRAFGTWARRKTENILLQRSQRVMVHSRYMRGLLQELHAIPSARVTLIPGGVDAARFSPRSPTAARRAFGLPAKAEIILTVRNLVPRMGLGALVDAFAAVNARRPQTRLIIAGDGFLREELRLRIAQLGLADRVTMLGRVDDERLPDLYRAADVFVLATSALEGFGLVTIEALSTGVPVVATPVGASPEILGQLDSSLVSAEASAEALADTLDAFLNRPAEDKKRLAKRARQLCVERYAWPVISRAFNELVRSVGCSCSVP